MSTQLRQAEEPQRTDNPRANAEWKADSGLNTVAHGVGSTKEPVNRAQRTSSLPEAGLEKEHEGVVPGEGSRGVKGWTGDGKGALNPDDPSKKAGH